MNTLSLNLRRMAYDLGQKAEIAHWGDLIKKTYGLVPTYDEGVHDLHWLLREIYDILKPVPVDLVKACNLKYLVLKSDMGRSRSFTPNHGYFVGNQVALNADIFYHPDQPEDFSDNQGRFISRSCETLLHEIGHAFDQCNGDLSLQKGWMDLSGWSKDPKPGLQRLSIKEPGTPEVIGEMYFDPEAGFTRFYAKRNPWDDFADSFAFYVAGMKSKVPENKKEYFDRLLKQYY